MFAPDTPFESWEPPLRRHSELVVGAYCERAAGRCWGVAAFVAFLPKRLAKIGKLWDNWFTEKHRSF
jgi:hypothetical protein